MQPFKTLKGIVAPLPMINIDTDMIIPKQYLKTIKRTGLGEFLFDEMRRDMSGNEIKDFVLNTPEYKNAQVLVAGDNFGCGSSREHAPWALLDYGIRCIIAPSFADIFFNNCFKNGMLPVKLPEDQVKQITEYATSQGANAIINIDLEQQKITAGNMVFDFEVDPFRRHCLLNGLDDIGLTLQKSDKIANFEKKNSGELNWLYAKA